MEINLFGGGKEIGGTKIQLKEASGDFVWLDFGKSFASEKKYYSEPYLTPRGPKELRSLKILPEMPGIYRDEPKSETHCLGVVISHPHTDHYDYARYLKPNIPIFASPACISTVISRDSIDFSHKKEYRFNKGESLEAAPPLIPVSPNEKTKIGVFSFELFEIDHSAPGSSALRIEAERKVVVYTGDIKFHGNVSHLSETFVEKIADTQPDILILEGTNIGRSSLMTEEDVLKKLKQVIGQCKGLTIAYFSPTDLNRMETFMEAVDETGRKLAVSFKQFKLIYDLVVKDKVLKDRLLAKKLNNISVFRKQKDTEYFWEKELYSQTRELGVQVIDAEMLSDKGLQKDTVIILSFFDFNELVNIQPMNESIFILSQSEPFDEESTIDFERLKNWLEYFGLPMFTIHSSGHADPFSLKRIIEIISPKKTLIVHSERPEAMFGFVDTEKHELIAGENGMSITF